MKNFIKSNFWNKKILTWDYNRYEKLFFSSNAIKTRMNDALGLIKNKIYDKHILEIGCGTGRIVPHLFALGAKSYTGIDFSHVAIHQAEQRIKNEVFEDKCKFIVGDFNYAVNCEYDVILSLGLLDWLTDDEICLLSQISQNNVLFLHSFSLKEISLRQYFHRIFVYSTYGYYTKKYRPRYFSKSEILANFNNYSFIQIICSDKKSFSSFIHNIKNLDSFEINK